jgi:hypothetical protein
LKRSLSDVLGLKVQLAHKGQGGQLRIDYKSLEQLDELCRLLGENRLIIQSSRSVSDLAGRCAVAPAWQSRLRAVAAGFQALLGKTAHFPVDCREPSSAGARFSTIGLRLK